MAAARSKMGGKKRGVRWSAGGKGRTSQRIRRATQEVEEATIWVGEIPQGGQGKLGGHEEGHK